MVEEKHLIDLCNLIISVTVNSKKSNYYEKGLDSELHWWPGYSLSEQGLYLKNIIFPGSAEGAYNYLFVKYNDEKVFHSGLSYYVEPDEYIVHLETYIPGEWEKTIALLDKDLIY